jgi:WD40 repeat protein
MRKAIRVGTIVCALLALIGLGWYARYPAEVHDWLRSLGRRPLSADEVEVYQRSAAVLPGLDGTVKVRVDDIERGTTADVAIIGPESIVLASKKSARVGDRLAFTHNGKPCEVEVIRYVGKIGTGDLAAFRIVVLPTDGPTDGGVKDVPPDAREKASPSKTDTYILKEKRTIRPPVGPAATVRHLAFADDGKTLGSHRERDGKLVTHWWDVATGEEKKEDSHAKLPERPESPDGVAAWAVSSDGKFAASAPREKPTYDDKLPDEKAWVVTVVDAETKQILAKLEHTDQVSALAFSPDGSKLAVGTKYINKHDFFGPLRGTITVWEVPSGKKISSVSKVDPVVPLKSRPPVGTRIGPLHGNLEPVFALAFSPDGTALASGHFFGDIKLWHQVKGVLRDVKVTDASLGRASRSIQGTWKIEGHPDQAFQQCVIGHVGGSRYRALIEAPPGDGKTQDRFFVLLYDPAEPHKVICPVLSGRVDRVGWGSCSAHGAEVTIRFADQEIVMTRISADLDAEKQDEFKHMTDASASEEGRAALKRLKDRKRNPSSSMLAGGGPYTIAFPAGAAIEDADVKDIRGIHGIDAFELANTQLKDDDLKFVASFKRLTRLNVAHTPVTDAGLKHLSGLKRLRALNLEHTKVTDAGLKAMDDLPSLLSLNLTGCDQVTQAGIAAAFRALPKLHRIGFGGFYQDRDGRRTEFPRQPEKPGSALPIQKRAPKAQPFQPPKLLSPAEIEKGQLLIDAEGHRAWSVEGLSALQDNSLVFGGDQATRAYLLKDLPRTFRLQFDFFQVGPGAAEFHLKGGAANTHPALRNKSSLIDLNVTEKRWQRCTLIAAYIKDTYQLSVKVEPTGKSITLDWHRSRQDGERPNYFVGFELGAGSKLYVRNLIVVAEEKIGPIELVANNQVGLFLLLGDDFARSGRYAQAIEEFTRALVVDPENVVCLERRAEAYGRRGRVEREEKWFDMGINDCSALIEKHPKASSTYRLRGLIRAWKGDQDRAIDDSNRALELNPKDAAAYNIRGWAFFNKNDLNKAIADYDRAIELDPKRAQAYLDRSIAHEKRGDPAKAKEDRTKASQFDVKHFPFR